MMMMSCSGAIGARTARACDSCLQRRARWFCAADDAFLCQQCDISVHSANPLARRHERVRLETASSGPPLSSLMLELDEEAPAWVHGLKRKARTPRKKAVKVEEGLEDTNSVEPLVVPDLEALLADDDENEEHLMCRVPIVEAALLAELNSPPCVDDCAHAVPMEQFAAAEDIEALLGRGLDDEAFCLDELGWGDKIESTKVELELGEMDASTVDLAETKDAVCEFGDYQPGIHFDLKSDDDENVKELGEHKEDVRMNDSGSGSNRRDRCLILKLNYEAVIAAWSSSKNCTSPWTDGRRPLLNSDEFLTNCLSVTWGMGNVQGTCSRLNGREARVTRYREKRQTRLFSKKIRYEVRKLNAEKRPRMKGRFVKRMPGTFPSTSAQYPY